MLKSEQPFYDDIYNLVKTIQSALRYWKLILPLMLITGVAMGAYNYKKQTTTVTATISYQNTDLYELMGSDATKLAVANKLGVTILNLPEVTLRASATYKNLFSITANEGTPQESIRVANTWAEEIIAKAKETESSNANKAIALAREATIRADNNLTTFLAQHNMASIPWYKLLELTGINAPQGNLILLEGELNLPTLTSEERLEVIRLLREKVSAEQVFATTYNENKKALYALEIDTNYSIVNRADISKPSYGGVLVNFALGAGAALVLAVILAIFVNWWKTFARDHE